MATTPVTSREFRVAYGAVNIGRYLAGSGIVPTSGIGGGSGTLSGPWYVETQSMDFEYWRTPGGRQTISNLTLSSSNPTQIFLDTHLQCRVKAYVSKKKTYGWFDTSSWTQPQTFIINAASADGSGLTYAGSSINASSMGPLGSVLTEHYWYHRRPWNNTTDVTGTSSISDAWTAAFAASSANLIGWRNANFYRGDYIRSFIPTELRGTHLSDEEAEEQWREAINTLPGGYSQNQETGFTTITTIDNVGQLVTDSGLVKAQPSGPGPDPAPGDFRGIGDYDITRHSYI